MAAAPEQQYARARTALMSVVTVLLAVAALKVSRPVTLPLVAGIFLVVLAWPLRTRLRRVLPGLLGVPLTAAVLIACRHFEATRWIAEMLTYERE